MTIEEIKDLIECSEYFKNNDMYLLFNYIFELYEQKRVTNTSIDDDGDMLLYQWGSYEWGEGKYFELNITRQTMGTFDDPDEQSDSMKQLGVTFKYQETASVTDIKGGNFWCNQPDSLSEFANQIFNHVAYLWAVSREPINVEVICQSV